MCRHNNDPAELIMWRTLKNILLYFLHNVMRDCSPGAALPSQIILESILFLQHSMLTARNNVNDSQFFMSTLKIVM